MEKKFNKSFPLRTTEETYKKVKELADKQDRSVNWLINKIIEKELKEREK